MHRVREAFQAAVGQTTDKALQGSLYLLGITRERSAHLVESVNLPPVTEFAELLRGRDVFIARTLTGKATTASTLQESLPVLQSALLAHAASSGLTCTHWLTGTPSDLHSLILELVEEESCRRGELTATLGLHGLGHL